MAVNSYDPTTGRPIFVDTDAPDIKVDPTEAAKYAADVGNRIIRANKAALDAYAYKYEGLRGYAIDTDTEYCYDGSGFIKIATVFAMSAGRHAGGSGFVTVNFPVGKFTQPPIVTVQVESGAGAAAGVAIRVTNVTSSSFQYATTTISIPVMWQAIQMTSAAAAG